MSGEETKGVAKSATRKDEGEGEVRCAREIVATTLHANRRENTVRHVLTFATQNNRYTARLQLHGSAEWLAQERERGTLSTTSY